MLDTISQITITLFGGTALWLMNCRSDRRRRWGVICGLCSQPAWYVQMVLHAQWLMLPVYCAYTMAWLFGLWNYWLKAPREPVPIHQAADAVDERENLAYPAGVMDLRREIDLDNALIKSLESKLAEAQNRNE